MHDRAYPPRDLNGQTEYARSRTWGTVSRPDKLICTIMHMQSRFSTLIAAEVRRARDEQELRQSELAFAAGVSVRTVHGIESGKPTIRLDVLERVLTALGLTIEVTPRHRRSAQLGEQ
jgi:HTH-type transcriptional regulator / antitoxin HipB